MGYCRFHRIGGRLFRLNLSKTGISETIGTGPVHLNVLLVGRARRNPVVTLSAPGTGLSYRETLRTGAGSLLRWLSVAAIGCPRPDRGKAAACERAAP
jgi:hypothetical protein